LRQSGGRERITKSIEGDERLEQVKKRIGLKKNMGRPRGIGTNSRGAA